MVSHWVQEENLRTFLAAVSELVAYRFDDSDWAAIEFGMQETEVEANRWFEYPLLGQPSIALGVAHDPGSSVVFVRAEAEPEIERKIDTLIPVFQGFSVRFQ